MIRDALEMPMTDPTDLFRVRDGIYAADLLIAAVAWLDFFGWLTGHPSDSDSICRGLGLTPRPVDVMLTLFRAQGLVQCENGRFSPTNLAREHLVAGSAWDLGPYYASLRERPSCRDMLTVLQTGRPVGWGSKRDEAEWARAMERDDFAQSFTAAMDSRGAYLAPAMARALNCEPCKQLLDIAGGSGVYACAAVAAHRYLHATVLEKPPVDRVARRSVELKGMSERVDVVAGDMFECLPAGYDFHLFSNVLHDWDVTAVETLLANSYRALPAGGRVAIHDAHINADKSGPLPVAEYSVLLMSSTEGKCYAVSEMRDLLAATGFVEVEMMPTVAYRSLITAVKPA